MTYSRIAVMIAANLLVALTVYLSTGRTDVPERAVMTAKAINGQKIWRSHDCTGCHAVYGLGGHLGPDLTNVISRRGEQATRAFIIGGSARMPAQTLRAEQLDQLTAYLKHLDETGMYPTKSFPDGVFGKPRR